jgi:outer membrane protein
MRIDCRVALLAACALAVAAPAVAKTKHRPVRTAQAVGAPIVPATAPAQASAKASMTLNEALAIAYETNPQLGAAQAGQRATDEQVAQANGAWRPTVSIDGSYGVEKYFFPVQINGLGTIISHPPDGQRVMTAPATGSEQINASITDHPVNGQATITQPIFRSGRTVAEIGRAKALVRAGRAQLTAAEQTVLLGAATAYMNVVRDGAIADLRRHNVEVLRKQRDSVQLEFKAGSLTRTDVAQSEARLANAQSDLTTALGQLATSRADFFQAIGRPAEALEANPDLPKTPATDDDLLGMALQQNPSLIQAKESDRAADYAVDDAWGAMGPTFSIQGQYLYSQSVLNSVTGFTSGGPPESVSEHAVAVLGQLHVPIYQAGVEEANVRQARELRAQSTLNVAVADRQVRDAVEGAWSTYQSALGTIDSNRATVKGDEIAFEGVSKEQQVGGRTVLDVLNAEQELLNAQVALVSSQRNAVVAAYQVLAAGGALTARNLGLKVKLYDPLQHYNDDAAAFIGFGGE